MYIVHNCPLIFFQKFQTKYSPDRKKRKKEIEKRCCSIHQPERKEKPLEEEERSSLYNNRRCTTIVIRQHFEPKNKKTAGQYLYRNTAVMKEPLAYYYEGVETRCKIDRCILHRIRKTLDDSRVYWHIFIATWHHALECQTKKKKKKQKKLKVLHEQ